MTTLHVSELVCLVDFADWEKSVKILHHWPLTAIPMGQKNSSPVAYMKNMICISKQDPGLTQYIGQDKHKISLFSVQI
jgi:hypothetical protein